VIRIENPGTEYEPKQSFGTNTPNDKNLLQFVKTQALSPSRLAPPHQTRKINSTAEPRSTQREKQKSAKKHTEARKGSPSVKQASPMIRIGNPGTEYEPKQSFGTNPPNDKKSASIS
jgi:hypothetical protein